MLRQIGQLEAGRIFSFKDLSFNIGQTANVAVLLSEQCRKGNLVRISRGAYYRPARSKLGLGDLPPFQDEQLRHLTNKLHGYITGVYAYNKMGLTGQMATSITIATPRTVRNFQFGRLQIVCVKAYAPDCTDETSIPYLRLLDAIKEMKHIPGTTEQEIYNLVRDKYFSRYSLQELEKVTSLAKCYPPRVRKTVSDLLGDIGQQTLQTEMKETLLPTTHFNMNYRTINALA